MSKSNTLHSIERGGKYNDTLMMTEYNGKIGLYQGNIDRNGKEWLRMCFPAFKGEPGDMKLPMGVLLGNDVGEALRCLEQFKHVLLKSMQGGNNANPPKPSRQPGDDDIPY